MAEFDFLGYWNAKESTEREKKEHYYWPRISSAFTDWERSQWARRNYLKEDGTSNQGLLLFRKVVGDKDSLIYFHFSRFCLMAKIRRYTRHHNLSISNSITLNPTAALMTAVIYTCPDLLYALQSFPSPETSK